MAALSLARDELKRGFVCREWIQVVTAEEWMGIGSASICTNVCGVCSATLKVFQEIGLGTRLFCTNSSFLICVFSWEKLKHHDHIKNK